MIMKDLITPTYEEQGHNVRRAFIIYEEPGKVPQKKGPFVRDSEAEKMLREMKPFHHPETKYTVAEITFDLDLWLTTASEFLFFREAKRAAEGGFNNNALSIDPDPQEYKPELWTFKKEEACAAIRAIHNGLEYARECLITHETNFGRTTIKNRVWAERMEEDIRRMEHALAPFCAIAKARNIL